VRRLVTAIVGASLAGLLAGSVLAVTTAKLDGIYRGSTSQKESIELKIVKGGKKLASLRARVALQCDEGSSTGDLVETKKPIAIRRDGRFSTTIRTEYPDTEGTSIDVQTQQLAITGKLAKGKLSGTITDTWTHLFDDGTQMICESGRVNWKAAKK
jgi:hypothetical protein